MNKKLIFLLLIIFTSFCSAEIIDFGTGIPLNPAWNYTTGTPTPGSILLDASGEKVAFIFPVNGSITFRKFGFVTGTVTTGDTLDVRLETVQEGTPSISPTNTLYCALSSGTLTIGSADDNKYKESSDLVSDCTVTNSTVAVVIYRMGSFNGNLVNINSARLDNSVTMSSNSASGYAFVNGVPNLAIFDSTSNLVDMYGIVCVSTLTPSSINSGTTPNTYGNKITLPFAHRVTGVYFESNYSAPLLVKLWDSDGSTVLETVTVSTSMARNILRPVVNFSQGYDFAANESYRVSVTPKTTTNSTIYTFRYETSAIKKINVQFGQYIDSTTGTNPAVEGDWTQNTLSVIRIFPMISQIDTGTSGGGTAIGVIGN